MLLLLDIIISLTFLNDALNGLKQYTSNACRTQDGNAIKSISNFYAYSIVSRATWLFIKV
jgi:hypothetical protein